jgi:hypothetical protein
MRSIDASLRSVPSIVILTDSMLEEVPRTSAARTGLCRHLRRSGAFLRERLEKFATDDDKNLRLPDNAAPLTSAG